MMVMMQTKVITEPKIPSSKTTLSFEEALEQKYVHQDDLGDSFILQKDKKISTDITLVGFGKISQIQRQVKCLRSLDLSGMNISHVQGNPEILENLKSIFMINLADNLLNWDAIIHVASCMPRLKEIIISRNKLDHDSILSLNRDKLLPKIDLVVIGKSFLDWKSIVSTLSQIWAGVSQLDLWSCSLDASKMIMDNDFYTRNPVIESLVNNIQALRLSQNHFCDIDWVARIGPIDNLKELDLSGCQLTTTFGNENIASQLTNLKSLNISQNFIREWSSVSILHHLINLIDLICYDNPFYDEELSELFTIGRLGRVQVLNRSKITSEIRKDAEILYLKKTVKEFTAFQEGLNPNFPKIHPHFARLIEIYGAPEDPDKRKINDKYLDLELSFSEKRITRRLPGDMRIANLQMLCKRLFGLKPSARISITCIDPKLNDDSLSYALDKGAQTLNFFSVESGSRLVIDHLEQ